MQIGPYLDLRHWWEYVYGKEFFDELVNAILDVPVYANNAFHKFAFGLI